MKTAERLIGEENTTLKKISAAIAFGVTLVAAVAAPDNARLALLDYSKLLLGGPRTSQASETKLLAAPAEPTTHGKERK